jgi:hypothetical protein
MRNKEQKGDLSVHAIAGARVVLNGIDFPEQKCPRLLGFALRRADDIEGEKHWLIGYMIFASVEPSPHLRGSLFDPKTGTTSDATFSNFSGKDFCQKQNATGKNQKNQKRIDQNL